MNHKRSSVSTATLCSSCKRQKTASFLEVSNNPTAGISITVDDYEKISQLIQEGEVAHGRADTLMKECNELRNKLADVGYSHAAERKILFERIEELMACNQNNDSNSDSEVSYDEATHVNLKTTRKDSSLKNIEHDVTYLRKLIELQEEDLKAKDKLLAENEKNLQQAQSTLADQEMNNSKLSQAAAVLQNENFQDYQEKLQTIDDLEYKLEETTRELRDTKEKIEKLEYEFEIRAEDLRERHSFEEAQDEKLQQMSVREKIMEEELQEKDNYIEGLEEASKQEREKKQNQIKILEQLNQELEEKLEEKRMEIDHAAELESQHQEENDQLKEKLRENYKYIDKLDSLNQEVKIKLKDMDEMGTITMNQKQEIEELKKDQQEKQKTIQELQLTMKFKDEKIIEICNETEEIHSLNAEYVKNIQNMTSRIEELENSLLDYKSINTSLTEREESIKALQASIKENESSYKVTLGKKTEEIIRLNNGYAEILEQLKRVAIELEESWKMIDHLETEKTSLSNLTELADDRIIRIIQLEKKIHTLTAELQDETSQNKDLEEEVDLLRKQVNEHQVNLLKASEDLKKIKERLSRERVERQRLESTLELLQKYSSNALDQ